LPDRVTILAERCERPEEIDLERAQEAKRRAEELLASGKTEVDYTRAEDALQRAETRLQVAAKKS
jgi:F-type H+-transporting ATPase subunit epsilon